MAKSPRRTRSSSSKSSRRRQPGKKPEPGPVIVSDDPQQNRWGGSPVAHGRRLFSALDDTERDRFWINLFDRSEDDSTLRPPIDFHQHDTFKRSVQTIRKIHDGKWAHFEEVSAYETSTV